MQHSKDFPDSFFRISVKGLCVIDGKILLVHESKLSSGKWDLPGGGLNFGEDVKAGLKREVKEETKLNIKKISDSPIYIWTHKFKHKRGLDWYYVFVLAYRIELENLNFSPTKECEGMGFFSKEELKNLKLSGQAVILNDIFNLGDFKDPF